jgi:hypothetical protein
MDEAVALLDTWLKLTSERSMFSSDEVRDLLLDFRQAMTRTTEDPEPELLPA